MSDLSLPDQDGSEVRQWPMEQHIRPTPDRKLRGELPSLETGIVLEIMKRFKEVED